MNDALGNVGRTVALPRERAPRGISDAGAAPAGERRPSAAGLAALARELAAGEVDTLVVTAWNPLHTAPADLGLRESFAKAKERVVLAYRDDETVRSATFRLAAAHPLESWGDLRARDGTATLVQPLIAPLVECATEIDVLAALLGEGERGAHRIVRDGWRARGRFGPAPAPTAGGLASARPVGANKPAPPDPFERRWEEWLSAGIVQEPRSGPAPAAPPRVDAGAVARAVAAVPAPGAGLEVRFVPDYKVADGRHLENAWLQELPDPVTKLTWENAAHLSPATAKRLGVESGHLVELARGGRKVTAPVLVVPGHADESVTLPLGYGQRVQGAVGRDAGFDAYPLRTADGSGFAAGLEVRPTGKRTHLAVTQGHFSMEGRPIALAVDASELGHAKEELDHLRGPQATILRPHDYSKEEYRWGMAHRPVALHRLRARARSPARRRTTSRWSARSGSSRTARCTGSASIATSRARSRIRSP